MKIPKLHIAFSFWILLRVSAGRRTAKRSLPEKRPHLWTVPDYSVGVWALE